MRPLPPLCFYETFRAKVIWVEVQGRWENGRSTRPCIKVNDAVKRRVAMTCCSITPSCPICHWSRHPKWDVWTQRRAVADHGRFYSKPSLFRSVAGDSKPKWRAASLTEKKKKKKHTSNGHILLMMAHRVFIRALMAAARQPTQKEHLQFSTFRCLIK